MGCNLIVSVFGQWTGNAVLGLLLGAVLDTAGIHDEVTQTNINLGLSCLHFALGILSAFMVRYIGRRPMLIYTNVTLALVWFGMVVATSQHVRHGSAGAARAILALIFIFRIVFATGLTSLVILYPLEVLSFEMRAKGFALSALVVNAAGLVNQFAWPVALASIGWKTYIILMVWCLFQAWIIYRYLPETRNRTVSIRRISAGITITNMRDIAGGTRRDLQGSESPQRIASKAARQSSARFRK